MTLQLPADALAEVVDHCRRAHPREACGIIAGPAGQPALGHATATRVIPMANTAPDPSGAFEFDVDEQLAAYAEMDTRGEDPVVLWHSHPAGPATPSAVDVAGAAGGTSLWLIVSLAGTTQPHDFHVADVRCWRIIGGQPAEVEIQVVNRDHEPRPAPAQPR